MKLHNIEVYEFDIGDLLVAGVNVYGPDENATVTFPEGTVQNDADHYTLPGGMVVCTADGFLCIE